jgi:hypothetical protein
MHVTVQRLCKREKRESVYVSMAGTKGSQLLTMMYSFALSSLGAAVRRGIAVYFVNDIRTEANLQHFQSPLTSFFI